MKEILTFLLVMICLHSMAQRPIVVAKPTAITLPKGQTWTEQIEKQRKIMEILKKDAKKKAALLNATLTKISLDLVSPLNNDEINYLFGKKKFVMYTGSKGIIVEANSFKLFTTNSQISIYEFSPIKTISYKELIDQNISFNMDLTQPHNFDTYFGYDDLLFYFEFSDGTRIWGRPPGPVKPFYTTIESKGEAHINKYLQPDIFPDLGQ